MCSGIVRKKKLSEYRRTVFIEKSLKHTFENSSFKGVYEVQIDHLADLNLDMLAEWKEDYEKNKWRYPLDLLYINTPEMIKRDDLKQYIQANRFRRIYFK